MDELMKYADSQEGMRILPNQCASISMEEIERRLQGAYVEPRIEELNIMIDYLRPKLKNQRLSEGRRKEILEDIYAYHKEIKQIVNLRRPCISHLIALHSGSRKPTSWDCLLQNLHCQVRPGEILMMLVLCNGEVQMRCCNSENQCAEFGSNEPHLYIGYAPVPIGV
jgi:hypothetical protein